MAKHRQAKVSRSPQRFFQQATVFAQCGNWSEATAAYRQHLRQHPSDKQAHFQLAMCLNASGKPDAAKDSFLDALQLDPAYPEALNNLGNIFHRFGYLEQARECFERALGASPYYEDAQYNLANTESDCGHYREAMLRFSRLLEQNPKHSLGWNNLGRTLLLLRQPAEALPFLGQALQLQPDFPIAKWNTAVAQLTLGDFEQGWRNFEHRSADRYAAFPRWDGSDLTDKQILVHAEQGLGDTIQFVRYCPLVKAFGGQVILECQPELVNLLAGSPGIDHLIGSDSRERPAFDCQVPLMSIPLVLGTTADTIPRIIPYLKARQTRDWEQELQAPAGHLKVGLVWAGSSSHHNDRNRSLPARLLSLLGQPENVSFYSLQQKPQSAAIDEARPLRFAGAWDDLLFEDTAAILTHLDLLISVDTSAAHLAGALGRPVWTLLPYAPDWRWLLHRSDTPWYPTMRLFRQPELHDWESVLRTVADQLRQLVGNG